MARASKRTSIILTTVAIIFIIVIIILCVIPDPCRDRDPRPECHASDKGNAKSAPVSGVLTGEPTSSTSETSTSSTFTTLATTGETSSTSTASSTTEYIHDMTTTPGDITTIRTTDDETKVEYGSDTKTSSTFTSTTLSTTKETSSTSTASSTTEYIYDMTTTPGDTTTIRTTDDVTKVEYGSDTKTEATKTSYDYGTTNATQDYDSSTTFGSEPQTDYDSEVNATDVTDYASEVNDTDVTDNITEVNDTEVTDYTSEVNDTEVTDYTSEVNDTDVTDNVTEGIETAVTDYTSEFNQTDVTETTLEVNDTETTDTQAEESEITTEVTESTVEESNSTTDSATTAISSTVMASNKVCSTKMCRKVAARMRDTMDHGDVNPCEDFYQYSCGGVIDDYFLKPEDAQVPANIVIRDALKRANRSDPDLNKLLVVYDSCLNYINAKDSNTTAQEVFESLGYKFNPLTIKTLKSDEYPDFDLNFDLSLALAKMMKRHFAPLFDIIIDANGEGKEYVYKLTLPSFTSPFSQNTAEQACYKEYKEEAEHAKRTGVILNITEQYADYVNCTYIGSGLRVRMDRIMRGVEALNITSHITNSSHVSSVITGAKMTLNFMLTDIYENMAAPAEIRRKILKKEYDIYSIEELNGDDVFGENPINFTTILKELTGDQIVPNETKIQVYFKDELKHIMNILNDNNGEGPMMQNMMLLLWTERVYGDLVKPIGPALGSEDYCFNAVTKLMDDYVTYLYLKELPHQDSLESKMKQMIRKVKEEAENQLEKSTSNAKDEYLSKLEGMEGHVASLNKAAEVLRQYTIDLEVQENDFVENYQRLLEHYRKRLYSLREAEPDDHKAMWSLLQFTYNAIGVTSYALNKFLIPHAVMSPPYYYGEEVPDYINFAGIGHMIAHEMMHGFDSTGVEYNGFALARMKPTNQIVHQTECFAEELVSWFNTKSQSGINYIFKPHQNLSLNELLADSAATKLAWDTYETTLNKAMSSKLSTAPATYATMPPSRRRRDVDINAVEGLRNRYRRQATYVDSPPEFSGIALPLFENFTALQLYYIKTAQNQCSASSELNIVHVMEREHLPAFLRVNLVMKHDPMFAKAFKCPIGSRMVGEEPGCQFNPLGSSAFRLN